MQMLIQFASASYSQSPSRLLLTAPPALKMLVAPCIAGYLPASIPNRVRIIVDKRPNLEIEALIDSMPTLEQLDAEFAEAVFKIQSRLNVLMARRVRQDGAA